MKIAVINSKTFIGKNLVENLKNIRDGKNRTRTGISIVEIYQDVVNDSDIVIMLPGSIMKETFKGKIIYISSLGGTENEKELPDDALIYRLPDIVGKWQSSDSIVAYLCKSIANDEKYKLENEDESIELLFIDDFIEEMLDAIEGKPHRCNFPNKGVSSSDPSAQYDGKTPVPDSNGKFCYTPNTIRTNIRTIVKLLESFDRLNSSLIVHEIPPKSLEYKLYSMYLSYLPERKMSYPVKMSMDNRGIFTELIKTVNNGQVSINIARPGNIRGQHWHNNKWEIFIVVSGHGLIQEREVGTDKVINFEVRGEEMRAVIMLPGYTHNIINLEKDRDLVTVMFANEQFDPNHPDTFFEIVDKNIKL